jgi:subtilisin-like proprotein convertase family protein
VGEIPDNDPNGAASTITVEEDGTVAGVTIDLEIAHTYRGDLVVELRHGGVTVVVFDGSDEANGWDDDVTIDAQALSGFEGSPVAGDWELRIIDTMGYDTGALENWALDVRLK